MRPTETAGVPFPWHARIRDAGTGRILGAGMLVGTRHVLTCAHVAGDGQAPPETEVVVEFTTRPGATTTGRVEPDHWIPEGKAGEGDLALLRLAEDQPEGCGASLRRQATPLGTQVHALGFPHDHPDGLWASMRLAGSCGPRGEWVQLNDWRPGEPRQGFSGAAVLNELNDHVMGVVVGGRRGGPVNLAYMIPVETVARYLPRTRRWVHGPGAVDPETAVDYDPLVPDVALAQRMTDWLRAPSAVRVITGGGPGQSRTLRSVIVSSDREHRPPDGVLVSAPPGTVSPAASLDLAVDASGKTVEAISLRILDRLGIPGPPGAAAGRVRDGVPSMTIVVYGIDEADDPVSLVETLLRPLAEQRSRLLLVFGRDASPALDQARSLESEAARAERAHVLRLLGELADLVAKLGAAERRAVEHWREVAPRVAGVPDPPDLVAAFRLRLLRHPDSAPEEHWTARELQELLRREGRAAARIEEYGRSLREALGRRDELRGRLETGKALAAGAGLAEDIELGRLYDEAHELLWDRRPCDVDRAGTLVRHYEKAVRRLRATGRAGGGG
ncbi:trypsin-like peptidase domain-containing protein [Streptosporangium sp. NPDC049376]|uniref:trypsin-like peptidase domain-containing protein n=1 Tax=Streptosporangium sp. NPDC049376 TaxID=3366192 RepID=UPI0037B8919D